MPSSANRTMPALTVPSDESLSIGMHVQSDGISNTVGRSSEEDHEVNCSAADCNSTHVTSLNHDEIGMTIEALDDTWTTGFEKERFGKHTNTLGDMLASATLRSTWDDM